MREITLNPRAGVNTVYPSNIKQPPIFFGTIDKQNDRKYKCHKTGLAPSYNIGYSRYRRVSNCKVIPMKATPAQIAIVAVTAVILGLLCCIEVHESTLSELSETEAKLYWPELPDDIPEHASVIVSKTITLHILRFFLGASIGLVVGYAITRFLPKANTNRLRSKRRKVLPPWTTVAFVALFILLAAAIWFTVSLALTRKYEPLTSVTSTVILKYSALLSVILSWLAVGRKIPVPENLKTLIRYCFLGPFNFIDIRTLNKSQKQVIWIGTLLVVFFIFFPPWKAYWTASNGEGIGPTEFVDFHFVLADEYAVYKDAPYTMAVIDRVAQMLFIAVSLVCTFLSTLWLSTDDVEPTCRS